MSVHRKNVLYTVLWMLCGSVIHVTSRTTGLSIQSVQHKHTFHTFNVII